MANEIQTIEEFRAVDFSTDPRATRNNATHEGEACRAARSEKLFGKAKSITYVGRLSDANVTRLDEQGDIALAPLGGQLYYKDGGGKCIICGGTHKVSPVKTTNKDTGKVTIKLVNKTTWYRNEASKAVFALSDSCRQDRLAIHGIEKVLTNPEVYRSQFPKAVVRDPKVKK